jgi:hypothetical protein
MPGRAARAESSIEPPCSMLRDLQHWPQIVLRQNKQFRRILSIKKAIGEKFQFLVSVILCTARGKDL